jgi:hypothetical protein
MTDIIAHIIRVLNIKDADDTVFSRLKIGLEQIQDIPSYLAYLEKYYNHADLSYMTGYQKYLELTKRYTKGLAERMAQPQIEAGNKRAKELAGKVKEVTNAFEESEYKRKYLGYRHKQLDFHSFKGFFTKEDTAILKTIGNLDKCIRLQESVSGSDALELNIAEILKAIAIKGSGWNAIEDKSRDVMKLAKTAGRKF